MAIKCIDVSAHQGVIPVSVWKKMRKDVPCCIIRCSWTHQGSFKIEKDKCFDQNIKNAYKAGMQIGVYHYSQAISDIEAGDEASYVLKTIKKYRKYITLPVVFDTEFGGRLNAKSAKKLGKTGMLKVCQGFCKKVQADGYDAMVYANLSMLNNYISATLPSKYKVWVAQYNKTCDYRKPYYMWQYTSSAKISGISGSVDMSYIFDEKIKPKKAEGKTFPGTFPTLPKRGYFKKGDKGENVRRLQTFLIWALDVTLKVDGKYGNMTGAAVMTFQEKQDLKFDGKFGKECLDAAKEMRR